ncbi:hypothetical protein MMC18_008215 [Xylographa bjoerkii]|nr:hypothetical protein [Xylographa bjoerkii]
MADPLSITMAVVGLIQASCTVAAFLTKITKEVANAPRQAAVALREVEEISIVLSQLQAFILRFEEADRSRTVLIQVDQVVVVLSGCVATFSELEALLDSVPTRDMKLFSRINWYRKETDISILVERLQTHKTSLSLLLIILTGESMLDLSKSVAALNESVAQFYQEMSQRLPSSVDHSSLCRTAAQSVAATDDADSIMTIKQDATAQHPLEHIARHYDFEPDLRSSRPYRKIVFDGPTSAISIRDSHTTTWSFLSGLSLADLSRISVISLVTHRSEIYNPSHYKVAHLSCKEVDGPFPKSPFREPLNFASSLSFPSRHSPPSLISLSTLRSYRSTLNNIDGIPRDLSSAKHPP